MTRVLLPLVCVAAIGCDVGVLDEDMSEQNGLEEEEASDDQDLPYAVGVVPRGVYNNDYHWEIYHPMSWAKHTTGRLNVTWRSLTQTNVSLPCPFGFYRRFYGTVYFGDPVELNSSNGAIYFDLAVSAGESCDDAELYVDDRTSF